MDNIGHDQKKKEHGSCLIFLKINIFIWTISYLSHIKNKLIVRIKSNN